MEDIKVVNFLPLNRSDSGKLLSNPDRGFRLEVALDVALNINPFRPGFDGVTTYLHHQYNQYKKDKPKLVQTYFYLSQYEEKDLDEKAFDNMQVFMDELKKMKLKSVLRFAYETDFNGPKGAAEEQMLSHMKQLAPFLEKNKDTIHVYQAGFIGAWGEWHSSKHKVNQKNVLEGILKMVPSDMQVQIRLPDYKNLISKDNKDYNRIGFHDDFLVLKPHVWDGGLSYNSPQYIQMKDESPKLLVDGELPWGTWSLEKDAWLIDGLGMINRLADHSYTSLSLIHNYMEDGENVKYSFINWKNTPVTKQWLIDNKLHFSPAWLIKDDDNGGEPSVFDYIRDHLGYRLEAQKLWIRKEANSLKIKLEIKNYGFAAPLKLVNSEFILLNINGEIISRVKAGEPKNWCPHEYMDCNRNEKTHVIEASLPLVNLAEGYKLGFLIENSGHEAVRLANSIVFEDGINILY